MNISSLSHQYFRREEANFVTMNDIDVMTLLMPTGAGRRAPPQDSGGGGGGGGSGGGGGGGGGAAKAKKKVKKEAGGAGGASAPKKKGGKDASNSLIVMALKRLTPVGMNLFAGREQELVQHVKDRFLQVSLISK